MFNRKYLHFNEKQIIINFYLMMFTVNLIVTFISLATYMLFFDIDTGVENSTSLTPAATIFNCRTTKFQHKKNLMPMD
jgi:hypothetical protein